MRRGRRQGRDRPRGARRQPLLWHQLDTGARRSRESGLLREGAAHLAALAERVDGEGARRLLESAGLR
ncbi:hypothetical protein ACFQ2B_22010 [Streptomyces stramineus]